MVYLFNLKSTKLNNKWKPQVLKYISNNWHTFCQYVQKQWVLNFYSILINDVNDLIIFTWIHLYIFSMKKLSNNIITFYYEIIY